LFLPPFLRLAVLVLLKQFKGKKKLPQKPNGHRLRMTPPRRLIGTVLVITGQLIMPMRKRLIQQS